MSERNIGKVISVDSFRAYIRLDDELKSLYKSGYEDIYEVARINSYVIIPIGADRIVAMVTSVRAIDETELGKNKEAIFLTKSARYLVVTMIGTIENSGKYIQGVYNYPILDNPVWYVTRQDLDNIFDQKQKTDIDFDEDYYLPIGTSPSFSDYKIKINPDKFFGKHAAILGNTGSGKSCTFASIIQSMFEFEYNGKSLQNAHIIIFDTNGEYRQAFQGVKENPYKKLNEVNAFHIDRNGMKVPFWFMNFADFDFLFEPTSGTQVPVFKRALGLAKNQKIIGAKPILDKYTERGILILFDASPDDIKKRKCTQDYGNWVYKNNNEILGLARTIVPNGNQCLTEIQSALLTLGANNSVNDEKNALLELEAKYLEYSSTQNIEQITIEKNIDLPVWFNFQDLITRFFDEAINEQENSGNRLREFVSTLRLRLESYLSDERIAQPLLLNQTEEIGNALAKFISFILGDFCKVYKTADTDLFTNFYKEQLGKEDVEKLATEKPSQVTIIDMSLLPFEVLETITGLIGRLILEFVSRFPESDRGKLPMVIALEEAQNYIPEKNRGERESIAKKVFERIAREGRKYGISLLVSSQRPSELSKTVLSQCNSFIIHRLQNPEDQKYIRQLVSAANEDILQQLPILPQQHVIIMGDAVRTPVQAKMNTANPRPNSNNPKFIENWTIDLPKDFPNYEKIAEAWEKGEKYIPINNEPEA
jgi:ABC-type oligopeptide transport system ATPase subunit